MCELAVRGDDHVGGAEHGLHFLVGAEVLGFAVDLAVLDHAVRRDQEAVLVDLRVDAQRRDQADVGAFRRLDRADAAVVAEMCTSRTSKPARLRFRPPGPRAESAARG